MPSNEPAPDDLLWLVIEDAYASAIVNGQKYVHTVKAENATAACRRVAEAIRGRLDGEGRQLLDEGMNLTVIDWDRTATLHVRDGLSVGPAA